MPTQLGDFISTRVYDGKLNSVHKIRDSSCVAFVDVFKGTEKQVGTSWMVCIYRRDVNNLLMLRIWIEPRGG